MNANVNFYQIPSSNFERAVKFYENVFETSLSICDCGEEEKMAFFPKNPYVNGAVFWAKGYEPSQNGVLISFNVEDMAKTTERIKKFGGKILIDKCKIEAEGMGYFAVFVDVEGNRLSLYSDL